MSSDEVTLMIHVGTGKTGTTSIQNTLKKHKDDLLQRGVQYLGLMLEYAPEIRHPWQKPTTVNESFYKLDADVKIRQLHEVLQQCIAEARRTGLKNLIWSNESLFDHIDDLIPVLELLHKEGVRTMVILYIRGYEDWAKSAYIQWGIKHKTYKGPLLPFRKWAKERAPAFYDKTAQCSALLGEDLKLRNFDETGDVLGDFLSVCEIDLPVAHRARLNEAPSNVELLLRAVYNARMPLEVLPSEFDRTLGPAIDRKGPATAGAYLQALMPSDADMAWLSDATAHDRIRLNELMERYGQRPLRANRSETESAEVDVHELALALTRIVVQQSNAIDQLQQKLEILNKRAEN